MERNRFIDFLKGICILFVIITHFSWVSLERQIGLFPFWIDMAVPVFMIISGFVYSKSFLRNEIFDFEKAYHPQNTLPKLVRYTVPFAIIFIIQVTLGILDGNNYSILSVIKLFFTGGQGPGSYYYPIMIQFVFLFPLIFALVNKCGKKGVLICGAINVVFEISKWAYDMNESLYRLLIFRYVLLIAVGVYISIRNHSEKSKAIFNVLAFAVSIGFILATYYVGYNSIIFSYWTSTCIVSCLFIIPIMTFLLNKCRLHFSPVEFIGKASFHIFLIQMLYYHGFANKIYALFENRAIDLVVSIGICIIGGIFFYLLESPVSKYINKKIKFFYQKREARIKPL